ncbi:Phosphatidylinositol 4-kinase LSB6 [Friedmanniomyces endolithicus]|nr:Phosphatidylinositol 4-kinase LSB6 [Friedmanniomyces endolithicus]
MPRNRPPTSGYARIAQAEEEEEEEEEEQFYSDADLAHDDYLHHQSPTILSTTPGTEYAPIHPKRRTDRMHMPSNSSSPGGRSRRRRTNSGVDIKAINLRLERWAEEIKEKFKIRRVKGKSTEDEHLEIYSSVFQAPEGIRPATKKSLDNYYDEGVERLSKVEFDDMVESVQTAIELGTHPTLISQGSSGSYFARNSSGKVLGVFKPKDEEPYANKNPKWTKWIHRNLFPFAFGRAMLIPNLSYVSEAAAYVLDCQLRTNIVPYTDVVSLSSKSFHYDFWERRAYWKKGRALPEKAGSFQVFLKGYKGATEFFREHPWPDGSMRSTGPTLPPKRRRKRRWAEDCRPGSAALVGEGEESDEDDAAGPNSVPNRVRKEFWTEELQQSFREELEKLVILDYIMRNTDRGTDNWMIRIDTSKQEAQLVMDSPKHNGHPAESVDADGYPRRDDLMTASTPPTRERQPTHPTIHLGAIDNSLSWPWKHPDAWRSYPFGWLFLPVSLIGRPFSPATRAHFLPLLTSKDWWTDTQVKLRRCFEQDEGFEEKMFARQIAVMKGQAWNVVECLKEEGQGPLELCRRAKVLVWDDVVEVPVARGMVRGSEEMRRAGVVDGKGEREGGDARSGVVKPRKIDEEEEEMDISAALASEPSRRTTPHDLLGMSSPDMEEQRRNPFNSSRQSSSQDISRQDTLPPTPSAPGTPSRILGSPGKPVTRPSASRSNTAGQTRTSLDLPTRSPWHGHAHSHSHSHSHSERRRRRFSLTFRRRGDRDAESDEDDDGDGDEDDGDGDLGFAAVEGGRGGRRKRKVIVERIEMVGTRRPVFEWC